MKYIFLLLLVLVSPLTSAQDRKLDSLNQLLADATTVERQVDLYDKISSYLLNKKLDTAAVIAQKGLDLARANGYTKGIMHCLNILGNYHERKTNYDKATIIYSEALKLCKEKQDTAGLAIILNNIAIIHTRTGKYDEAIKLYFEALEAEEITGNQHGIAEAYNNIGIVYYYQRQFGKTVEYLEKSIAIEEKLGNPDILKKGYNNIGAVADHNQQHDKALLYYRKAFALSKKIDDKRDMASNLGNMAISFYKLQKMDSAYYYHEQSLAIKEALEDYRGIAYSYNTFGLMVKKQGAFQEAEEYYNKSLAISLKKNLKEMQSETYKNLANLAKMQKQFEKANSYLDKYIAVRDSMLSEQNSKAMAEMESKYETAKKEKEILAQQAELDKQALELQRKNTQLIVAGASAVIILLLGLLVYNYQHQKNKRLEQEKELQAANAKLETQAKLQKQRLRISRDLHDNIGAQLTFIISSVDNLKYGFRLENERLIHKLKSISTFVGTTIHALRDTIWAMNKDTINFADLEARIQSFLAKAQGAAERINFSFDLDKNVPQNYLFSSIEGMNIHRIIQESVNNSLKYANANKVVVNIKQQNQMLHFIIKDDGNGFDMDLIDLGNGLNNMEKRALEIGAKISINSEPTQGTIISLSIPAKV